MTRELFNYPTTPTTDGWASFEDVELSVRDVVEVPRTDFTIMHDVELGDELGAFILANEPAFGEAVS